MSADLGGAAGEQHHSEAPCSGEEWKGIGLNGFETEKH